MESVVRHMDHLNMTVRNFEETVAWYRDLFGFELVEQGDQMGTTWGVIRGGDSMLCIYETPDLDPVNSAHGHGIAHFGLRLSDPEAFLSRAEKMQVRFAYGGAVRHPHSTSYYVTDPTGYEIEVAAWDDDTIQFDPIS